MVKVFANEMAAVCTYPQEEGVCKIEQAMSKEDNLFLLDYCRGVEPSDVVYSSQFILDCIQMAVEISQVLGKGCQETQQVFVMRCLQLLRNLYVTTDGHLEYIQEYLDKEYMRKFDRQLQRDIPTYTYVNYPMYSEYSTHKVGEKTVVKLDANIAIQMLLSWDYQESELESLAKSIVNSTNADIHDKLCDLVERGLTHRLIFLQSYSKTEEYRGSLVKFMLYCFKNMSLKEATMCIDTFWEYHKQNNTPSENLQRVLYTEGMLYIPSNAQVREYALKVLSDIIVLNPKVYVENKKVITDFLENWVEEIAIDEEKMELLHYFVELHTKYPKPELERESKHRHIGDCVEDIENIGQYKGNLNSQQTSTRVLTAKDIAFVCNYTDQKWYVWHIERIISDVFQLEQLGFASDTTREVLSVLIPYSIMGEIKDGNSKVEAKIFEEVVVAGDKLLQLWDELTREFRVYSREDVDKLETQFEVKVHNKTLETLNGVLKLNL